MKNLSKMTVYEIESWLRCKLEDKWSERDLQILSSVYLMSIRIIIVNKLILELTGNIFRKCLSKGKLKEAYLLKVN